jgi:hypothetical protein
MLAQDSDHDRARSNIEARDRGVSAGPTRQRKIIHIDMDAFFASVEQRDNPELRGRPVAVGGSRERGVVAAASYEARAFGVHSAMASVTAKRKCPDLIFVKPRFDVYRAVSLQIRAIFAAYTPINAAPCMGNGRQFDRHRASRTHRGTHNSKPDRSKPRRDAAGVFRAQFTGLKGTRPMRP